MKKFIETTISTKNIYNGRILNIVKKKVKLPDGNTSFREIAIHRGAVALIPFIDKNHLIMVKQYRKAIEKPLLEIPAGTLENGENPLVCARRELVEETGYYPKKLKRLYKFHPAAGYSSELIHIYLATDLIKRKINPEEDEFIETKIMHINEIYEYIENNKIIDSKTIIGLMIYKNTKES